ncbi:MAG: SCP2 sterol-binding domain-containing protein [Pseudomonadota bacterium]
MLDSLTDKVRAIVADKQALGFDVMFDFGDVGVIHVAGDSAPMRISNDKKDAATVFIVSPDDFGDMMTGELQPMMAYMSGKLKVEGDLSRAMQVASMF